MKFGFPHRPFVVCSSACIFLALACNSTPPVPEKKREEDRSLVIGEKFGNVENGSAFDKAIVDVTQYKIIVLPDTAAVHQDGEPGKLQIFMKKTLSFHGHPPEPMSIRLARKNMGCALQIEKDGLVVATFGEWDSHIEGGANMNVLFVLPKGHELEKRAKLSGENSVGREWNGKYLTKPREVTEGYWYGPSIPGVGWEAIATIPDQDRKAQ
jgi:hypothetical protein